MSYIATCDTGYQVLYLTQKVTWSADPFNAHEFQDKEQASRTLSRAYKVSTDRCEISERNWNH